MSDFSKLKLFGLQESSLYDKNFCDTIEWRGLASGIGETIGNSIRRILFLSVPGYAIKNVTIAGIQHEYSVISGVKEDTPQLIKNLRKVIFKGDCKKSTARLNVKGPMVVKGSDIDCSNLTIVNQDLEICSIDKGYSLSLEMYIERGVGVKLHSEWRDLEIEIGSIICDSFFSPIENVSFYVEQGNNKTEDLYLKIITNGSISPADAFKYAYNVYIEQLNRNTCIKSAEIENIEEDINEIEVLSPHLYVKIEDIPEMPLRTLKALKMLGVSHVGDLVKLTKADLMKEPNFGDTSLNHLISKLAAMDLQLGMNLANWPPADLEKKAREVRDTSVL